MGIVLPEGVFNNPSVAHVRRFVEDRARLYAVVSLPADTFAASGALVKTSLLFLRKFTEDEHVQYNAWTDEALEHATLSRQATIAQHEAILATSPAKQSDYLPEQGKITSVVRAAAAKSAKDFNGELRERKKIAMKQLKQIQLEIQRDARAALRQKARYPIFMYDADKVGITATGAEDDNELFPNLRLPAGVSVSALEQFHRYLQDPTPFLDQAQTESSVA